MNIQSKDWYELLVELQQALGSQDFFSILTSTLKQLVHIDCSGVIFYNGSDITNIYQGDFSDNFRKYMKLYMDGLYLLDPHYSLLAQGTKTGLYRFRDITPDCYHETKYFNAFIKPVGISDEYDFIVKINNCYIDFYLDLLGGQFSQQDSDNLVAITPMITHLITEHWKKYNNDFSNNSKETNKADNTSYLSIFDSFGKSILTQREQDVVQCILHGHSSKSLANKLDISPSTVKIHRKHIYQKLDITTQSELFSLCIQSLSIKGVSELEDPLQVLYNLRTS